MTKEQKKAYECTCKFYETIEGDRNEKSVMQMIAEPENLLRKIRKIALEYGCTQYTTSFAEDSYYSYQDAKIALSALLGE